ncbi:ventral anterior homeobox 2b-like [Spodoptera frugiperda]|uniref:Ventral anterior homeobox 2b-like n=1 Tax=Spodoptera frugiperda TaxID=7108 RepID=A0A9R0F5V3_SPOFR|nr:ventral anterior homeobox 2b-like [Spodoptera frugiperda]
MSTNSMFPHWMSHQNAAVPVPVIAPNRQIWLNGQLTGWPAPAVRPQGLAANKKPKRVRTAFTTNQLSALEEEYKQCRYLAPSRRHQLANILNIHERIIKIWFQNRRMKEKKDLIENQGSSEESSEGMLSPIMHYPGVFPNYTEACVPTTPNLTSEQYSQYMYGTHPIIPPGNSSAYPWHTQLQVPSQLEASLSAATAPTTPNLMSGQYQYSPYVNGTQPITAPGNVSTQTWHPEVQAAPQEASHPVPNLISELDQYSPNVNGNSHPMVPPGDIPAQPLQAEQVPPQQETSHPSAEQPAPDVSNESNNSSWDQMKLIEQLLSL